MNPFKFGTCVDGPYFTDRNKAISDLIYAIKNRQPTVLISPRRYGKTSVIKQVLKMIKYDHIYIDLELISDTTDLANTYMKNIMKLWPLEKAKRFFSNLTIQPNFQYDPKTGSFNFSFTPGLRTANVILRESLDLPEKIYSKTNKNLIVVFDEFQDIRRIGKNVERVMRAIFQHHKHIAYIFIGSKESIIRDIFENRKNPFYKLADTRMLRKIPYAEMKKFIIRRFKDAGINAEKCIDKILNLTNNHPYYTQQLCHKIIEVSASKSVNERDIENAIEAIINEYQTYYKKWWTQLNNTDRNVIIAFSQGNKSPTSRAFIEAAHIKSPSTSQKAIERLLYKGVVCHTDEDGYNIEDIFWKEWIIKIRNSI